MSLSRLPVLSNAAGTDSKIRGSDIMATLLVVDSTGTGASGIDTIVLANGWKNLQRIKNTATKVRRVYLHYFIFVNSKSTYCH